MPPQQTADGDLDRIFEMLSHQSRRRILSLIREKNPREEDELSADALVGDGEDPKVLKIELTHVHLPKLEDAGYVEWNHEAQTIRRGPRFDEIAAVLRLFADHQDELPVDWT